MKFRLHRRSRANAMAGCAVAVAVLALTPAVAAACPADGGPAVTARGQICAAWDAAPVGTLGGALNDTHRWGNGYIRDFDGGSWGRGGIMVGDSVGYSYIVGNPIGHYYWDAFTRSGGVDSMGYPLGRHEFGGHLNAGPNANTYMTFQTGVINSWSGGTFATHGAILDKWNSIGNVQSGLGRPLSNEYATAAHNGAAQHFEHGYITYNPAAPGAFVDSDGPLLSKYIAVGSSTSPLGLPRSDVQPGPRGNIYQVFDGGVINEYSGVAFETHGAILARWNAGGGATGALGLPTSDEAATSVSPQGTAGRYSRFEHGVINYNPKVNRAVTLFGAIGDHYASLNYSASYLGLPTSEEYDWNGGRRQDFEGGYIAWTAAAGAWDDHHPPPNPGPHPPPNPGPHPLPNPGPPGGGGGGGGGGQPRYVIRAIGDSYTAGFGLNYNPVSGATCGSVHPMPSTACDDPGDSWADVAVGSLRTGSLAGQQVNYVNKAVSGSTPGQWLGTGLGAEQPSKGDTRDFQSRLADVISAHPHLILLSLGGNDFLRNPKCARVPPSCVQGTQSRMTTLLRRLVRQTPARIYVLLYPALPGDRAGAVDAVDGALKAAIRATGSRVKYIPPPSFAGHNCFQGLHPWRLGWDKAVFGFKCVHPNKAGSKALGQAAVTTIRRFGL